MIPYVAEALEGRRLLSAALPSSALRDGSADLSAYPFDPERGYRIGNDAFYRPSESLTSTAIASPPSGLRPYGAQRNDTSEFMIGDVYVTVVLLESNGATDVQSENWTAGEIANVKSEIRAGLTWWEELYAKQNFGGSLRFTIDYTYADTPVATAYEPITRPSDDQDLWIDSFLTHAGYNTASSYFTDMESFDDAMRTQHDADWAYTIFVVDSTADTDNMFSDDYFAYAYLGGPFMVMTYENDGWGIGQMEMVTAHETGHIFYALDEYPGSGSWSDHSGYYNTQNLNAKDDRPDPDPQPRVPSIMAESSLQTQAYSNDTSSPTSLQMIGWQDSDGDKIIDLVDVPITLTGASGYIDAGANQFVFAGTSSVATLTNLNPIGSSRDITINEVDFLQYRFDGGTWTNWNTVRDHVHTRTYSDVRINLPGTWNTIEIRTATDTSGLSRESGATSAIYSFSLSSTTVELSVSPATFSENAGIATVTATLSAPTTNAVTVSLGFGGTALRGTDYVASDAAIVIAPGNTTGTVRLTGIDDLFDEAAETIVVDMASVLNAGRGTTQTVTATLADDDPTPTVQFTTASQSGSESGGALVATFQLSAISGQDISIPYTIGGTATGSDYSITASPIIIPAGLAVTTIVITPVNDTMFELSETVILTLGTPTNASKGTTTVHTATITNDDSQPTISIADASILEGNSGTTNLTFTVSLSNPTYQTVTVNYATADASATTAGADYAASSGSLTFNPGITSQTVSIVVSGDARYEADETFQVSLSSPSNATAGDLLAIGTITNDDATPTVQFLSASQSVNESGAAVTVTLQLSAVSGLATTVPFSLSGLATAGTDYSITPSPITIPAGSTTATITLTPINETRYEDDETAIVTLGTPTNATLGGTSVFTLTIINDDSAPTVQLASASQNRAENSGDISVVVQLSAVSGLDTSIPFSIGGTAIFGEGNDYTITSGPLLIPAGSSSSTITVTLNDDSRYENSETVVVTLDTPSNATLGGVNVHTLTIINDDAAPSVQFVSGTLVGNESGGAINVIVQLSAASGVDTTIPYLISGTAAIGTDCSVTASPLLIPAGVTSTTIVVTPLDDNTYEPDETVVLTFNTEPNQPLGAITTSTVTIRNDDAKPTISIADASILEGNSGTTNLTFTVSLSNPTYQTVTVNYATADASATTADADYAANSGSLTFNPGTTSQTVSIVVSGDARYEANETFQVSLTSPTNATAGDLLATGTITNDDVAPTVQFISAGQSSSEAGNSILVTVQLSAVAGIAVTVPFTVGGTTEAADDFSITSGPLVFAPGVTSSTITITPVNDDTYEANETVVLTLGTPANATLGPTSVHTATIIDDDPMPAVEFVLADQTVAENAGTLTIAVRLSNPSYSATTVSFLVSGGKADYSVANHLIAIPARTSSSQISFTIIDDGEAELTETLVLSLDVPPEAAVGRTVSHALTILDNESPVLVIDDSTATERDSGSSDLSFTVTRLGSLAPSIMATYRTSDGTATAGSDYASRTGAVTIGSGVSSAAIVVPVLGETLYEPEETFTIQLDAPAAPAAFSIGDGTAVGTIPNDDPLPRVQFAVASRGGSEGADTLEVLVQLSNPSYQDVLVPFTLAGTAGLGTDYTLANSSIVIPAGKTSASIAIRPVHDNIHEPGETVVITLGNPTNATLDGPVVHTLTIENDDPQPTIQFVASGQTLAEGSGAIVSIQLSNPSYQTVIVPFTFSGTATLGEDYSLDLAPLVIPAGQTSGVIPLTIVDDTTDELTENLRLTVGTPLNGAVGAQSAYTITIPANDKTPPRVTAVTVNGTTWTGNFRTWLAARGLGSGGYKILTGAKQLQPLPWSNINQIKLTFSETVSVQQRSMVLTGVNSRTYGFSAFSYDPATFTATWTLPRPLPADKLLINLNSTVTDATGNALDGEWSTGKNYPSGNGKAGGVFRFRFNMLPGDTNRNNSVNTADVPSLVSISSSAFTAFKDVNGSASITAADQLLVRQRQNGRLPGGEPAGAVFAAARSLPVFSARLFSTRRIFD